MANAFVQVQPDSTGKKVQVFENSVGGQTVEAQATVAVDTTGAAISPALDGTDGASPPSIAGTGIRGWLRAIYDRLVSGLARTWTLAAGTDAVTATQGPAGVTAWKVDGSAVTQPVSGPLTDAQLRASAVPISAASLPLPTGAAQEHTGAASFHATRLTDGTSFYKGTTPADTQPISAASLPLPSNAAQETGGNLATLVTRTPPLGAATIASSRPVNIASDQTVPVSAASLPLPAGAATAARQDTGNTSLTSLDGKLPAQGQAQMTASVPVTFASDQVNLYDRYDRRSLDEQRLGMDLAPRRSAERGSLPDRRARQERGMR